MNDCSAGKSENIKDANGTLNCSQMQPQFILGPTLFLNFI